MSPSVREEARPEDLLPNSSLQPGFPRHTSIETAQKWLALWCFLLIKACTYFDSHEWKDMVEERVTYLKKMAEIGFLFPDQASTAKDIPPVRSSWPSLYCLCCSFPKRYPSGKEQDRVLFPWWEHFWCKWRSTHLVGSKRRAHYGLRASELA